MAKAKNLEAGDMESTAIEETNSVVGEATPVPANGVRTNEKPVRLAYVGPNIPGGILQRYQVFKGGLPPYCKGLFEKVPEIKELFVPVTELENVRRKIEESGTNEARLFYIVQQATAKGVK